VLAEDSELLELIEIERLGTPEHAEGGDDFG
jgi:hypothetical protein